jgi:lysophospholipase L1-like esterase
MFHFIKRRSFFLISLIISMQFFSGVLYANDSDVVNCNHAWKIVILGSSTSYGLGATVYDSSWAGRFTAYVQSKNSSNQVINLGKSGITTYQNLRPDGYVPPTGRPTPFYGNNITAALSLLPDAIIINMPSNDAVNGYSLLEQQANFEATMRLADSANVPVWVTTTQPRLYLTTDQVNNLTQTRDWIISRFGNKSVNFWETVANADGSINSYYDYDYAHVNNIGHNLFFTRMRAECILDTLCNRLIPPCNFSVGTAIIGNSNACGNMGVGDSAIYSITANDAVSYSWSVSNAAIMGLSLIRNNSSVKIKYASTFTSGTINVVVTGCDGTSVTKTLDITKTIPGSPSAITSTGGGVPTTYICPFIGGSNLTYVAAPPATNASSVIAYRWTLPTGSQLISVNAPDSSSITIKFPTAPTSLILSVMAISGCGNSAAKSITLNKTAPSAPLTISGITDICNEVEYYTQTENISYTASSANNAASYFWTVPTGATLVSGQGTTSINVIFVSTFVSGNITVQSISPCGNSVAKSLTVYKRVAAAPALIQKEFAPVSIAAVTNVCGLISETYRIKKVAYATSYNWNFTNGNKASINHINGFGINDTAVVVTFLSGFTKDTFSVSAITECNTSMAKTIILNSTLLPPTPTNIISSTGNYNPCLGNQIAYTVVVALPSTTQTVASVYRWTKPNNTTIISATSDSSSITLQFNAGYAGGAISVKGQTACGQFGTAKTVNLQYSTPTPTSVVSSSGVYNACIGSTITFSMTVPAPTSTQIAAVMYRWTRPNYTTILSANADSSIITLLFNTGFTGGSLTVKGQTACGNYGSAKTQLLTNVGCASGTKMYSKSSDDFKSQHALVFPNPNNGNFTLKFNNRFKTNIIIRDVNSSVMATYQTIGNNEQEDFKINNLNLPAGLYFISIQNDNKIETIKMVISD